MLSHTSRSSMERGTDNGRDERHVHISITSVDKCHTWQLVTLPRKVEASPRPEKCRATGVCPCMQLNRIDFVCIFFFFFRVVLGLNVEKNFNLKMFEVQILLNIRCVEDKYIHGYVMLI